MAERWHVATLRWWTAGIIVLFAATAGSLSKAGEEDFAKMKVAWAAKLRAELRLKEVPFKLVYETYRGNNWELFLINADGSNPVNLTRTVGVDEMYPHASPDGSKVCFVADEMMGDKKVRNVYYMNIDGSGRTRVAVNARQSCWGPDGRHIAYLKAEFDRYTTKDYATRELFIYDLATRKHKQHPNSKLHHLYNICWTPDGNWFLATVHGGMGYRHAQLAFEAGGTRVFDLTRWRVTGCRLDITLDGKRITWGRADEALSVGNIELRLPTPRVTDVRDVATCPKKFEVYHGDWSPDGKYIAFSFGPAAEEIVGGRARGWNICVADLTGKWAPITTDGKDNKEPDWAPLRRGR